MVLSAAVVVVGIINLRLIMGVVIMMAVTMDMDMDMDMDTEDTITIMDTIDTDRLTSLPILRSKGRGGYARQGWHG